MCKRRIFANHNEQLRSCLNFISELFEKYLTLLKLLPLAVQFVNKFTLRSFNRNFWSRFSFAFCRE